MGRVLALCALGALAGCSVTEAREEPPPLKEVARQVAKQSSRACASSTVYERIKAQAFSRAASVYGDRSEMLDRLAGTAIVRMDSPFVKGVDAANGVTICGGQFIVELPPGLEDAFDGDRRIVADVEYATQPAADGSGLVFRVTGAEPVIYRLAAVALKERAADERLALAGIDDAPEAAEPIVEPEVDAPSLRPVALAAVAPPVLKQPDVSPVRARPVDRPIPDRVAAKAKPLATKLAKKAKEKPRPAPVIKSAKAGKAPVKTAAKSAASAKSTRTAKKSAALSKPTRTAKKNDASSKPTRTVRKSESASKSTRTAKKSEALAKTTRTAKKSVVASKPTRTAARKEATGKAVKTAAAKPTVAKKPAATKLAGKTEPAKAAPKKKPAVKSASAKPATLKAAVQRKAVTAAKPPQRKPVAAQVKPQTPRSAAAKPSAARCAQRNPADRLVCNDRVLAAKDRRVRSITSEAIAGLPPEGRRAVQRSAARFDVYRSGCQTAACVERAYQDRLNEIDDIAADYGD